jgi:methylmalonyl-CoA/ethylmalonyl-CoA epimerase
MVKGINHLGIVVESIDRTIEFLRDTFGAEEVKRMEFPKLKQISSIVRVGSSFLELMEPTAPDGVAGKFLQKNGGGLHHVSLLCENVEALSAKLEARGLEVIGKMFEGPTKVAFMHPKSTRGILFELAEETAHYEE